MTLNTRTILERTTEQICANALDGKPLNKHISDTELKLIGSDYLMKIANHKYTKQPVTFEDSAYIQELKSANKL